MAQQNTRDEENSSLLESIFSEKSVNAVLLLIERDPTQVRRRSNGNYPLHAACWHAQYETVILKLIELFPQAAKEKNSYGDYPLHIA